MNAFSSVAVVLVLLVALGFLFRPVLRMVLPGGGWGKEPRGATGRSRAAAGVASLETGAFISLLVALVTMSHGGGLALPLGLGLGLAAGLVLLPELTRPLLGIATAGLALMRLEPAMMGLVIAIAAAFYLLRAATSRYLQT